MSKAAYKRQKSSARGASSRQQGRAPIAWKTFFNARLFYRFLYSLLLLATLAGIGYAGASVKAMQVSRVVVNGEFRQVEKQRVEQLVAPFLHSGFVSLDLAGIRARLRSEPWIFDASITRQWPDEILISVEEQTVIARWGKVGFLNHRGELFIPESTQRARLNMSELPLLEGPDHSAEHVMRYFRQLNDALAPLQMTFIKLELNGRGGWYGKLSSGVDIYFGADDVMGQMKRFIAAYNLGLGDQFNNIASIDLRHNQGLAVGWHEQAAAL